MYFSTKNYLKNIRNQTFKQRNLMADTLGEQTSLRILLMITCINQSNRSHHVVIFSSKACNLFH